MGNHLMNIKLHLLRAHEHLDAAVAELATLPGRFVRMTADVALVGIRVKALAEDVPVPDCRGDLGKNDISTKAKADAVLDRILEICEEVRTGLSSSREASIGQLAAAVRLLDYSLSEGDPWPSRWLHRPQASVGQERKLDKPSKGK